MSIEDRAQEHEAKQWELRNLNRTPLPPPAQPGDPDFGPAACSECGGDMPLLRRAWRLKMCTPCTSEADKMAELRRRRG